MTEPQSLIKFEIDTAGRVKLSINPFGITASLYRATPSIATIKNTLSTVSETMGSACTGAIVAGSGILTGSPPTQYREIPTDELIDEFLVL